jgi:hypothetical protein
MSKWKTEDLIAANPPSLRFSTAIEAVRNSLVDVCGRTKMKS